MADIAMRSGRRLGRNSPVLLKQVAACVGSARYSKNADRELRPLKCAEKDSANLGQASDNWRINDVNLRETEEISEEETSDVCKESGDVQDKVEPDFDSSANQNAKPQLTTVEHNPWSS